MTGLSFVEVFAFTRRVARRFVLHHGLLLASAIAFDSLLSVVPLLALSLVLLSLVLDPSAVATLISLQLESMLPGAIEPVIRAYATFLERREAAGSLGAVGLLVFGTMAFRTIRDAIAIIFDGSMARRPRSWHAFVP